MRRSSQFVADLPKAPSEDGQSLVIYRQRQKSRGRCIQQYSACQYLHHPSYISEESAKVSDKHPRKVHCNTLSMIRLRSRFGKHRHKAFLLNGKHSIMPNDPNLPTVELLRTVNGKVLFGNNAVERDFVHSSVCSGLQRWCDASMWSILRGLVVSTCPHLRTMGTARDPHHPHPLTRPHRLSRVETWYR